jgi:hypothetical protein
MHFAADLNQAPEGNVLYALNFEEVLLLLIEKRANLGVKDDREIMKALLYAALSEHTVPCKKSVHPPLLASYYYAQFGFVYIAALLYSHFSSKISIHKVS